MPLTHTAGAACASAGKILTAASAEGEGNKPIAAVYYRFASQAQAERFVAGPQFADAKAQLLGTATVTLSMWKVRSRANTVH